jgi:hypothetical protein
MEERQNLRKFETRLRLMLSLSDNEITIVMLTGSLTFIVYTVIMMVLFVVVWSIYLGCHFWPDTYMLITRRYISPIEQKILG